MKIQDEVEAMREKVNSIDLEPIAYKLAYPEEGEGWDANRVYRVIEHYRCFLTLTACYEGGGVVPTKEIDKVWHTHILDTVKYRDDCQRVFGRFIDHFPYFGLRGEQDAKNLKAAFSRSMDLFKHHFDVDPSERVQMGGDAAMCGGGDTPGSCTPSCDEASCGTPDNEIYPGNRNSNYSVRPSLTASLATH